MFTRLLLSFGLAAALVWAQPMGAEQGNGVVEGTIVDAAQHLGIAGVSVHLQSGGNRDAAFAQTIQTEAMGRFRFTGLKRGRYSLNYFKDGYADAEPKAGIQVESEPVKVDGQLAPWARLSGRVLDAADQPAAGVRVDLLPMPIFGGTSGPADPVTDAEGRYTLDRVSPGTYTVRARPPSRAIPDAGKAERRDEDEDRVEVVSTYLPSTVERSSADKVVVRPGAEIGGQDIRLRMAPVRAVRGVVLDENGKPVAYTNVTLTAEISLAGASMQLGDRETWIRPGQRVAEAGDQLRAQTRADGGFEFPSVIAGDWKVIAQTILKGGRPEDVLANRRYGSESIRVGRRDVDGIEIRFQPSFTLPVQIEWVDTPVPQGQGEQVFGLIGVEPESGPSVPAVPIGSTGSTEIRGVLPGRYRMFAMLAGRNYFVASIEVAGRDVRREPIFFTAASPPVKVVLKPNPGAILGMVEKGPDSRILLWVDGAFETDFDRLLRADANGSFRLEGLAPASYRAVALDRVEGQITTDAFQRLARNAKLVRVDEGSTSSVQLELQRWE